MSPVLFWGRRRPLQQCRIAVGICAIVDAADLSFLIFQCPAYYRKDGHAQCRERRVGQQSRQHLQMVFVGPMGISMGYLLILAAARSHPRLPIQSNYRRYRVRVLLHNSHFSCVNWSSLLDNESLYISYFWNVSLYNLHCELYRISFKMFKL